MAFTAARIVSSGQLAVNPSCINQAAQSSAHQQAPVQFPCGALRQSGQPLSSKALESGHGHCHGFQSDRIKVHPRLTRTTATAMGVRGSSEKAKVEFVKYQGLGNDFLLVDNRNRSEPSISPEQAAKLCDRNFGVGGDGVIFVLPGKDGADYTMRIYNSDSSEPEMCGNGIRCMAKFVADLEQASGSKAYTINTLAGPIKPVLRDDGQVVVDMGPPILKAADIPTTLKPTREDGSVVAAPLEVDGLTWAVTCVSMGNPHCITFGCVGAEEGLKVSEIPLAHIGPLFERNPVFPARINTEFVEVVSRTRLKMRVWERGAGPTLACGTGACALLVAAVLEGRAERTCTVELPGGPLEIEWRQSDNHVYMTGPAEAVFEGIALVND